MSAHTPPNSLLRALTSPPKVAAPTGLPTRTGIDEWSGAITDLSSAAAEYRQCASKLDAIADDHCEALSLPGGTDWAGDGADAARAAGYADRGVIWQATDHIRNKLARAADDGAHNVNSARNRVQDAIDLAERDEFTVGDDLSISDTRTYTDMSERAVRMAKATEHSQDIVKLAGALVADDAEAGRNLSTEAAALSNIIPASWGIGGDIPAEGPKPNSEPVDHERGESVPDPGREVQMAVPPNRFVGDWRFGHWEQVIHPPFTGSSPPPLKSEYRPLRVSDDPAKLGGTTGMYTPGRNWLQDSSAPYVQYKEEYRFRIAGEEATTFTRTVTENGVPRQERWVQNIYEYQQNTQYVPGGDVRVKGKDGGLGGLMPITTYDNDWKQISPQEIVSLSADNSAVKYYLPDGCGGQFTMEQGVPIGGYSGLPPIAMVPGPGEVPPSMHQPR